jgi:chromate transporter
LQTRERLFARDVVTAPDLLLRDQDVGIVEGLFFGLQAAVVAVVIEAVLRIGRRVIKNAAMFAIAALAFIAIFFFNLPFPLIVLAAGLIGFIGGRMREDLFYVIKPNPTAHQGEDTDDTANRDDVA